MLLLVEGRKVQNRRFSWETDVVSVLGATVIRLRVFVPERCSVRRKNKALRRLRDHVLSLPVDRVLYRDDFPLHGEFSAFPLPAATDEYIIRLTAGELLCRRGGEEVLLVTDRADRTALTAFFSLCRGFRYVYFAGGSDEVLSAFNRAGEPLGVTVTRLQRDFFPGDGALVLSPPERELTLRGNCAAIRFAGGTKSGQELISAKFSLPEWVKSTLPAGYPVLPLIAYAAETGRLTADEITVIDAAFGQNSLQKQH